MGSQYRVALDTTEIPFRKGEVLELDATTVVIEPNLCPADKTRGEAESHLYRRLTGRGWTGHRVSYAVPERTFSRMLEPKDGGPRLLVAVSGGGTDEP